MLTEAALHFGRQKKEKQALLLVQRYKKFSELLPRAEAELQRQLAGLVHTPPHERQQLVQQLKQELRAMAEGGWQGVALLRCPALCVFGLCSACYSIGGALQALFVYVVSFLHCW